MSISSEYINENDCVFCLEPLNNKSTICKISCNHIYHYECVRKWTKTTNIVTKLCPQCNNNGEIVNIKEYNQNKPLLNNIDNNNNSENSDKDDDTILTSMAFCCNIL